MWVNWQWAAVDREHLSPLIHPSLCALTRLWRKEEDRSTPRKLRATINLIKAQFIWHAQSIGEGRAGMVLENVSW